MQQMLNTALTALASGGSSVPLPPPPPPVPVDPPSVAARQARRERDRRASSMLSASAQMAIGSIVSAREMAEEGHHRPSNFDKASVEASPIVVLPHLIRPGLTLFGDRAKTLFPPALYVINSSDEVWKELMEESPPTMIAVLTMADEWVAANIILCVKRDAHGVAFVSQLPIVGASSSGRKVLKRLLAIVAGKTPSELRERVKVFEALRPFVDGMPESKALAAKTDIMQRFAVLPARVSGSSHYLLHSIIDNFVPASLQLRKDDWSARLHEAELFGKDPPWAPEGLLDLVVLHIAKPDTAPSVSSAERERRSAQEREREEREASAVAVRRPGGGDGKVKCAACGADGHMAAACTKKCTKCSSKYCVSIRVGVNKACDLGKDKPFPTETKNALGQPAPPWVKDKRLRVWASHNKECAKAKEILAKAKEVREAEAEKEVDVVEQLGFEGGGALSDIQFYTVEADLPVSPDSDTCIVWGGALASPGGHPSIYVDAAPHAFSPSGGQFGDLLDALDSEDDDDDLERLRSEYAEMCRSLEHSLREGSRLRCPLWPNESEPSTLALDGLAQGGEPIVFPPPSALTRSKSFPSVRSIRCWASALSPFVESLTPSEALVSGSPSSHFSVDPYDGDLENGTSDDELSYLVPYPLGPRSDALVSARFAYPLELERVVSEISHVSAPVSEEYPISFLVDGGANTCLMASPALISVAEQQPATIKITGVGGKPVASAIGTIRLAMPLVDGSEHTFTFRAPIVAAAQRDILSESILYDTAGARTLKEPVMQIQFPDGAAASVHRHNGLYFVHARVVTADAPSLSVSLGATDELLASTVPYARLWAARFGVRGERLAAISRATPELGIGKVGNPSMRAADVDVIVKRTLMRNAPAPPSIPDATRPPPGRLFIADAFGPVAAKSVVEGARFELIYVDASSSYGYHVNVTCHTTKVWIMTALHLVAKERTIRPSTAEAPITITIRFDRAPELDNKAAFDVGALRAALLEVGALLEYAPRHCSTGVAAASSRQRLAGYMAEGYLERVRKGLAFYLSARDVAHEYINFSPCNHGEVSRQEAHGMPLPNFKARPPLIFGTEVSILNTETERGPKGVTPHSASPSSKARSSDGVFVQYQQSCYGVLGMTGKMHYPNRATPLNEIELAARGLPSSASDACTQTDGPSHGPPVAVRAPAASIRSPCKHVHGCAGRKRPDSLTAVLVGLGCPSDDFERDEALGGSRHGDLELDAPYAHLDSEVQAGGVFVFSCGVPCETGSSMNFKQNGKGLGVVRTADDPDGDSVADPAARAWLAKSLRLALRLAPLCQSMLDKGGGVHLEGPACKGKFAPGGAAAMEPGLEQHSTVLQGSTWADITAQLAHFLVAMCMCGHKAHKLSDVYISHNLVPFCGPFLLSLKCDGDHEHVPLTDSSVLKSSGEWTAQYNFQMGRGIYAFYCALRPSPRRAVAAPSLKHFPPPTSFEQTAPIEMRGPPSLHLRRGRGAKLPPPLELPASVHDAILLVVEAAPEGAEALWLEAAVEQFAPEQLHVLCAAHTIGGALASLRTALAAAAPAAAFDGYVVSSLEVNKAKQSTIKIQTKLGVQTFVVPSTTKEVMDSPQREQWLQSIRDGITIVISAGNLLIRRDDAKRQGIDIINSVAVRSLKLQDPAADAPPDTPRHLREERGFATRVCADETALKALKLRQGKVMPQARRKAEIADLPLVKSFHARAASEHRSLAKIDVSNAYPKADRKGRPPVAMRIPVIVRDEYADEDGEECLILLVRPHFGEGPSGDDFDIDLMDTSMTPMGWHKAEGVPALLFALTTPPAWCVRIVDDILIQQDSINGEFCYDAYETCVKCLLQRYGEITYAKEPTGFAGLLVQRDVPRRMINISMPYHILDLVRAHCPQIEQGVSIIGSLPKGVTLQRLLDSLALPPASERVGKLSAEQQRYQVIIGLLRYPENVEPSLSLPLQRAATVTCFPPMGTLALGVSFLGAPVCVVVANCLIELAHNRRTVGITYGGRGGSAALTTSIAAAPRTLASGAPTELEGSTDATWSRRTGESVASARDVYFILITMASAAVYTQTKGIKIVCESSMDTEGVGLVRGAQVLYRFRAIDECLLGKALPPIRVNLDNESLRLVISRLGLSGLSRASARRYVVLGQRFDDGEIDPQHVADADMMADFGTKWLPAAKLRASLRYASNSVAWYGDVEAFCSEALLGPSPFGVAVL